MMTGFRVLPGLAVFLLGGCAGPSFTVAPKVVSNPNPRVPQAAVLTFAAGGPVATTIHVSDTEHAWDIQYDESHDPSKGLAVVGMRPDRRHEIRVTIRDAGGAEITTPEPLEFTTPPLPDNPEEFPPIEVAVSKPEEMEPGVTLFNPRRRKVGLGPEFNRFNAGFGMLLALDAAGEVIWYYRVDSRISDFEKLQNGNLLVVTQDFRLIELDWLGNTVNQWYAKNRPQGPGDGIAVEALTFHHEVDELPSGNIVVLGSEWREIDNYYTSETNASAPRKKQKVMGDVIHEFERETGRVVWEWKAFDHMDPFRIGYETFSPYWVRRGFPDMVDWTHANNLLYDEQDDSIVINYRYQAAAMKIDRKTKQIKWIFGEPSGWGKLTDKVLKPDGEVKWPYHQHSPNPTPKGTLLIYDNGNYQARPFTPAKPVAETYSRAVEYAIDEAAGTVREVWQSEQMGPERVISVAMGDVDWLPETENVLVAYGALLDPESIGTVSWEPRSRLQYSQWTRVREYKRTDPPEVVYEVIIRDEPPMGWTLFGAERLPRVGP
ncbi:MAG: aryl-sulfate sulfotransferase [bacterium]|nr:aryl-sulfate sulfotransferase [bacterium]